MRANVDAINEDRLGPEQQVQIKCGPFVGMIGELVLVHPVGSVEVRLVYARAEVIVQMPGSDVTLLP